MIDQRENGIISASEISQYLYCNRAWWLQRVHGLDSENVRQMSAGTAGHNHHGRALATAERIRRIGYGLIIIAILFISVWILLG